MHTEKVVLIYLGLCVYNPQICVHQQLVEKEARNLKERKVVYIERMKGGKQKRE